MYLADLALLLLKRDDARTEAGGAVASNLSHLRSDYFSEFMQAYAATLVQSSGSSESSESSGSTDSRAMSVALLLRSLSLSSHPLLLLHAAHCVQMLSDVPEGPVPNPNPVPSPRFQLYGGFTQAYEHAIAMHSGGALRAGTGTSTVSDSDSDTHTLTFDAHLLAAQQLQTVPAHTASLVAQLRAANAGLTIHRGIVGVSLMDIRN
ncbi:hypothetical protein B484DRAFT_456672 [Ochromonadaceae sp. CCMP2298]|nr:hypothetical protein B484DRAFT_456672 [Ochromonadaceae sp. CCMP2298]